MIDKNSNDLVTRSNLEKSLGIRMSEYSTYSYLSLQFTKAKINLSNKLSNSIHLRRKTISNNEELIVNF